MTKHLEIGKDGEIIACEYLISGGYTILYCNWRYRQYEIDIIAVKNNVIHFIEVKTRTSYTFGYPEESVTPKKFNNLKIAAAAFLGRYKTVQKIQFDILAITKANHATLEIFLIEDVYF
jgi:putative endonuclease